ncbi:MAG TPA: response regulator transcription factor [Bryobacteraceae bacterium]|nr:response regulator transcription factor [Bryobacteraceae bacterium]
MGDCIKLVIVDDQSLFRSALFTMLKLESDFEVVGQCADVERAVSVIAEARPDVVLLDVDLNGRTGGELLNAMPPGCEKTKVLLVTGVSDPAEIAVILQKGAQGAFSKSSESTDLPAVIRRIAAGEQWVDPIYLSRFVSAFVRSSGAPEGHHFSDREREILTWVCRGLSNKEIAAKLMISEAAVKAGMQRLFQKYGVRSRAQLIAVTSGILH